MVDPAASHGRIRIGVFAGVAVACLAGFANGPVFEDQPPPAATASIGSKVENSGDVRLFDGTGSCSGRGCHGGIQPKNVALPSVAQNEYSIWLTRDPHVQAYAALASETATRMMKILSRKPGYAKSAASEPRCLACHSTPTASKSGVAWNPQGVSCDGCHGSAAKWEYDHVYWDKKDETALRKHHQETGMAWLRDPVSRAQSCVGCHIGAPASAEWPLRDMNHDMIAAGHPRLHFDFHTYVSALPKHWRERDVGEHVASHEWLAGQLTGVEATLRLAADRAEAGATKKDPLRPWPELAEGRCFSCHRPIPSMLGRRNAADPDEQAMQGRTRWRDLYSGPASVASPLGGDLLDKKMADSGLVKAVSALDSAFAFRPRDGEGFRDAALQALGRLHGGRKISANELSQLPWAARPEDLSKSTSNAAEAVRRLDRFAAKWAGSDWELAVQWYFGLAALEKGRTKQQDEAFQELNDPSRYSPDTLDRLRSKR